MENTEIKNKKFISEDGFEFFIPSDHPLLEKGFFKLIGEGKIPLEYKLLKQIFFDYNIQNNVPDLIKIINFVLPLDLSIKKKFISDILKLTNYYTHKKKLKIKINKEQIFGSLNENWNIQDLKNSISEYVKFIWDPKMSKEIKSKFPDISFLKRITNFKCNVFEHLSPTHYFQEDVILHIMENLLYKKKYNGCNRINPLIYISRFGSEKLIKEIFDKFQHFLPIFNLLPIYVSYQFNPDISDSREYIPVSHFNYIAFFSKKEFLNYILKKCGLEEKMNDYINENKKLTFNHYDVNVNYNHKKS